MRRKILCAVLGLAMMALPGWAVMLEAGTQEISVQGRLDLESESGTTLELEGGYGYFVVDFGEIGLRGRLLMSESLKSYRLGGFGEYHFDVGFISVPFMGGGLGLVMSDPEEGKNKTALYLNGVAGVKIYLLENVALAIQGKLEIATDKVYPGEDEMERWDFTLDMGLRFYF